MEKTLKMLEKRLEEINKFFLIAIWHNRSKTETVGELQAKYSDLIEEREEILNAIKALNKEEQE